MDSKELRRLMRVRELKKRQRPDFPRLESWRYRRLERSSWRRPIGLDNKTAEQRRGWHVMPTVGFRGPAKVRGLHPSGKEEYLVYRQSDLLRANPERHVLRIARRVGRRNRVEIENQAAILGFKILNPKQYATEKLVTEQAKEGELELGDLDYKDLAASDTKGDKKSKKEDK